MSPEISVNKPSAVMNLQSFSIENNVLTAVAHRHDDQLVSIRPNLEYKREQDQPEIFCEIKTEDWMWNYKTKYISSDDEWREAGIYPVIRFRILSEVASVADTNDFSKFNQV
jgi:hypothetical protein